MSRTLVWARRDVGAARSKRRCGLSLLSAVKAEGDQRCVVEERLSLPIV
jgi:hypothetical protein